MDTTTPTHVPPLPNIDWVHAFPLGVGGAADDARNYTFNGALLRRKQYVTRRGLRWVNEQFVGDLPAADTQRRTGGRQNLWSHMGRWIDGCPITGRVVLISDLRQALGGACKAVIIGGAFGYGLIEWAPAWVSIDGVTEPALQIRSRAHGRERETIQRLRQLLDIRLLLEFPSDRPGVVEEALVIVDPELGELGRFAGATYEVHMRPPADVQVVVDEFR
jgi:hypothetical protein